MRSVRYIKYVSIIFGICHSSKTEQHVVLGGGGGQQKIKVDHSKGMYLQYIQT